jgi:hypothetical protein
MSDAVLVVLVGVIGLAIGFALGLTVAALRAPRPVSGEATPVPPEPEIAAPRQADSPVLTPDAPTPPSAVVEQDVPETASVSAPMEVPAASVPPDASATPGVDALPATPAMPAAAALPALPALPAKPAEKPISRPSFNPVEMIARAIQTDARTPIEPPKSIAMQVDEILQEMLKDSPLASRAIKLLELPGKGMVVMVGLDQYDGVDSVPDQEIRDLLRAAVAQWEVRATGQLS